MMNQSGILNLAILDFKLARSAASSYFYPWEYVLEKNDAAPVDLNEGVVYCNGDYCEDSRLLS